MLRFYNFESITWVVFMGSWPDWHLCQGCHFAFQRPNQASLALNCLPEIKWFGNLAIFLFFEDLAFFKLFLAKFGQFNFLDLATLFCVNYWQENVFLLRGFWFIKTIRNLRANKTKTFKNKTEFQTGFRTVNLWL